MIDLIPKMLTHSSYMTVGVLGTPPVYETHNTIPRANQYSLQDSVTYLHRTMNVNCSREEYLEWVAAWKVLYSKVSDVLRCTKDHRDGHFSAKSGSNTYEIIRPFRQTDVHNFKGYAREMMNMRSIYKILAGRQMMIEREKNPKVPIETVVAA